MSIKQEWYKLMQMRDDECKCYTTRCTGSCTLCEAKHTILDLRFLSNFTGNSYHPIVELHYTLTEDESMLMLLEYPNLYAEYKAAIERSKV